MTIKLICLDADDTLWHNMRHFNAAFTAFQSLLAPFADADVTQAALDAAQDNNLSLYGYGAKGFTLSMVEAAADLAGEDFSRSMVKRILDVGRDLLTHPVELLDGIDTTLQALAARGRLVLITKGDLLHQEVKLAASGVGDLFSAVRIVSDKTTQTFRSVFAELGVAADEAVMAGDSMRSDILPALDAGAFAAYIPQSGAWLHEQAKPPIADARFRQLERLADLVSWIDDLNATASGV